MSRYEVIRPIAKGGMAEVLLARSVGEGGFAKEVALKRILGSTTPGDQTVRMLMDEARLAARLTHPNIVQVFDFGRDDEGYFIAMEYVPGPELTRLLSVFELRRQRAPADSVLSVIIQALRGLDYAHRLTGDDGKPIGLVHRDISPSNILITTEGVAKLSDFGIAKAQGRLSETQVGMVKGKVPYMSPEQTYGRPLDQRSDIFSMGLVLWECLAGRRCYNAEAEMAVMALAAKGEVPPLSGLGIGVTPALSKIVERATAVEPGDRYQTAAEMAQALETYHRQTHPRFTSETLGNLVREILAAPIPRTLSQAEISTNRLAQAGTAAPPSEAQPITDPASGPSAPIPEPKPATGSDDSAGKPTFRRPKVEAEPEKSEGGSRKPDWKSMVPPTTEMPLSKPGEGSAAGKKTGGSFLGFVSVIIGVGLLVVTLLLMRDRSREEQAARIDPDAHPAAEASPAPLGPGRQASTPSSSPREAHAEGRTRASDAAPPTPGGAEGYLDIRCDPWCEIQIDGKGNTYRSPASKIAVGAGTHHLRLTNPEVHLERKATVVVNPGETVSRYFNLVMGP